MCFLNSKGIRIFYFRGCNLSKADKIRFYNIACGSVEECRYYLILTKDIEYGNTSEAKSLLEEVSKLLEAHSQSVSNSES